MVKRSLKRDATNQETKFGVLNPVSDHDGYLDIILYYLFLTIRFSLPSPLHSPKNLVL